MSALPPSYQPSLAGRIELTEALPELSGSGFHQGVYTKARLLVTLHGHPLGMVDVALPANGLQPNELEVTIKKQLRGEIDRHLLLDGFTSIDTVADFTTYARTVAEAPCWSSLPADEDLPFVSIVIATKDRSDELRRCLQRLQDLDYPSFEIVIIDNGASSNQTKDLVENEFADKGVRYFSHDVASASIARNLGLEKATGEIVAFTDDDVVVDPLWLKALIRGFSRFDDAACVTGLVIPASFDFQAQQWFEEYGGFNKGYQERVFGREQEAGFSALYPYTAGIFGSGNNSAFRRQAIIDLGGWDTDLGPGTPTRAGEDLDAFLTIILNGQRIAYEPSAIIGHFHRDEYKALEHQLFNYGIGLTAVFTKWFFKSPKYAFEILARVPHGVWIVLNPNSAKNIKKSNSFPKELGYAEIKGMIKGPFLYWKSKRRS